jgi:hypothetical protein
VEPRDNDKKMSGRQMVARRFASPSIFLRSRPRELGKGDPRAAVRLTGFRIKAPMWGLGNEGEPL